MAHFALLWKARTIEKYRQNYENEKINSIIMSSSEVPDKTLFQRWRHYKHGMQKRLSRTFSKWYPEGSTVSNFFVNLRADMKLPSILLRSLYGFIGGLLLTYLAFMFFVFQLSVSEMHATILSSIIGVLLTLGLTFSNRMRCLIFLLVPQLFSRVGRYTLTCYALVLILTGPATNTLKNLEILSESMACSQEQIKWSIKQINDSIKKPSNSMKDSLKLTIERMNIIIKKLKTALIKTNKLILSIATIIQSGYSWLNDMADSCNDALGAPREICLSIMKEQCDNYNEKYKSNSLKPKYVNKSEKNFIKDLLHAIGVKNVKLPHEESFEAKDKTNVTDINKDIKHDKSLKILNAAATKDAKNPVKEDNVKKQKSVKTENVEVLKNNIPESVCNSLQSYKKFCVPADFVGDTFLATIKKKLKIFVFRISKLVHVKLNIEHTYTFIGNSSTSNQIAAGIVTEIRNRADPLLTWLSWSSCVTSLFLLLIFFRAKHYQHMFETRSRFDNRFITKEFRELDLKRLREGRETVLPLNTRERAKYVTTTSFRLVASEKLHLNRSAVFMTVATFKLLIHVVADYSLYWVLATIRHHGTRSSAKSDFKGSGATITGTGFVARLLQAFVDTMDAQLSFSSPEQSCLPNPHPPDIKRYCQIGFLIFLLWFFALFEPYGLRLRHLIMGHYRPQRAKDRAVWLYNHVLRTRASFMKFARRKLHREYKYSSHSKLTVRHCLVTCAPLRWLSSLLGIKPAEPRCLLCNVPEVTGDLNKELIKCEVPNCPGIYCPPCFSDIGQLCTICLSPSDYGDYSDVSLQNWTSDEENSDDDNPDDYKSNTRKTNSDFYTMEDDNNKDGNCSKRNNFNLHRKPKYSFGRSEKKGSDTITLLKHSIVGVKNDKKEKYQSKVMNSATEQDLMSLAKVTEKKIKEDELENDAIPKRFNRNHIISAVDLLLYSLYEITKNPLQITKFQYTTNIAKYLRRRKFIRHKRCIEIPSKYFMTCSHNNINMLNDNFEKDNNNNVQNHEGKDVKNSSNEAREFNNHDKIKNFEPIDDTAFPVVKRTTIVSKGEFHTAFSKYWKNAKSSVLQDKNKEKKSENLPPTTECLHKRKKKRKKITELTSKKGHPKLNEKEKQVGNSRLFAFLDDKDWINYGDTLDNKEALIAEENISNEDNFKKDPRFDKNVEIVISDIVIPKLELNLSSGSNKDLQMVESNEPKKSSNIIKRRNNTRIFCKIIKIIACSSCKSRKSNTDKNDVIKDIYREGTGDFYIPVEGQEQKSTRSAKANVCFRGINVPPDKTVSNENIRRSRLVRLSYPLFVIKCRFSSILRNKKRKDTAMDEKNTNVDENQAINKECKCEVPFLNEPCEEMLINVPCEEQFINIPCKEPYIKAYININAAPLMKTKALDIMRNKIVQCKIDRQNKAKKSLQVNSKQFQACERETQTRPQMIITGIIANLIFIISAIALTVRGYCDKEVSAYPRMVSRCCPDSSCSDENNDFATRHSDCSCSLSSELSEDFADQISVYRNQINEIQPKDSRHKEKLGSNRSSVETIVFYDDSTTDTTVCRLTNIDYNKTFRNPINYQLKSPNHQLRSPIDKRPEELRNITPNRHRARFEQDYSNDIANQSNAGQVYQHAKKTNDQSERRLHRDEIKKLNHGRKVRCRFENDPDQFELADRVERRKVKVVTKANQSTLTDKATRCDVSTATNDWWSPIVEKRNIKKCSVGEKRRKDCGLTRVRERRTYRSKGVSTTEKIVSFRSTTQLIPIDSVVGDIMSPARYLLESQKYYNELFNDRFGSPRVYPVTNLQRNWYYERDRSQNTSHNNRRRGRKTKRLEESYSPRKDIQPSLWKKSKLHEKSRTKQ